MNHSTFCLYGPPLSTIRSYFEMVDLAADHGITQLEILNIFELAAPDQEFAHKLRAYAQRKGITFPCVSVGIDLVGDDGKEAVESLKQYAHIAKILGSPFLHHTIALNYADPELTARNFETFYARGLAAVREVFDYAKDLGIRTVYEDQGFLFNGKKNFTRFLQDVGRNVGIVADFGNIQFVDEHVEGFISAFADRIVHVHVKDYLVTPGTCREKKPEEYTSRGGSYLAGCRIGEGSVHMEDAFLALQAAGYKGAVSLEGDPIGPDEALSFRKNLKTVNDYLSRYL